MILGDYKGFLQKDSILQLGHLERSLSFRKMIQKFCKKRRGCMLELFHPPEMALQAEEGHSFPLFQ